MDWKIKLIFVIFVLNAKSSLDRVDHAKESKVPFFPLSLKDVLPFPVH